MKISLITDEISADPETAIELGLEWGVRAFELRGFGTDRVPRFSGFQKDRLNELLSEFDVRVIAISPGLFKCPYPRDSRERFPVRTFDYDLYQRWRGAHDVVRYHLEELLPRSIEYAREIGAERIVAFSFHRGTEPAGQAPDEVLEALRQAAVQVGEAGPSAGSGHCLQLVIEVEDGFWADTGQRTADLVKAIGHPALGVNWDPANAFVAGETPYPDGYQAVRDVVKHVHFKDVRRDVDGRYRYVTEGEIDWAGQMEALARDGYDGYISVETHTQPKVRTARVMTERLQRLIRATRQR